LIDILSSDKQIQQVRLENNYFSEQIESFILESLSKNQALTECSFTGNRFSHSFLQKLQKLTARNLRLNEEQEPNKLKSEINRLKYEYTKLEEAKAKLKKQKVEVETVKKLKSDLQEHIKEYKAEQENKRQTMNK